MCHSIASWFYFQSTTTKLTHCPCPVAHCVEQEYQILLIQEGYCFLESLTHWAYCFWKILSCDYLWSHYSHWLPLDHPLLAWHCTMKQCAAERRVLQSQVWHKSPYYELRTQQKNDRPIYSQSDLQLWLCLLLEFQHPENEHREVYKNTNRPHLCQWKFSPNGWKNKFSLERFNF